MLIVTSHHYQDFDADQRRCLERLFGGAFGYHVTARFDVRYLPPRQQWWALAGWGTRGAGKISPRITILRRSHALPETH